MLNLNRATIIGNLTREPELRYTPGGQPVTSFGVATNRSWNDQTGEKKEEVEFHEVVAWGKLAEICTQILGKGKKVYVEGRLKTRQWEAPDGAKRQKTEIIAENVIALDPKSASSANFAPAAPQEPVVAETEAEVSLDEVPTEELVSDNNETDKEEVVEEVIEAEEKKDKKGKKEDDIPF